MMIKWWKPSINLKNFEKIKDIAKRGWPNQGKYSNRLENKISEYSSTIGLRNQKISNSWFNIQQKGSVLKTHLHANSVLSGALYVNVDENSTKLYFNNPNNFIKYFEYYHDSLTDYNFEYFYISPNIGDLVIFPSWLEHGSNGDTNNTVDRTVLSFNTTLE